MKKEGKEHVLCGMDTTRESGEKMYLKLQDRLGCFWGGLAVRAGSGKGC